MSRREALEHRLQHARRDIEELAAQVAEGEVAEATAARLRAGYEEESASLEAALDALPEEPTEKRAPAETPRVGLIAGVTVGVVVAVTAAIVAVIAVGRDDLPSSASTATTADLQIADMEAAVAAQESNELRLTLADTYFDQGDYLSAIEHYAAVLDNNPTPVEESLARARIGWMAYITGELDAAVDYLTTAVALDPTNAEAHVALGIVLLYGLEDPEAAIPVLEAVLELPSFPSQLRPEVESLLTEAREDAG